MMAVSSGFIRTRSRYRENVPGKYFRDPGFSGCGDDFVLSREKTDNGTRSKIPERKSGVKIRVRAFSQIAGAEKFSIPAGHGRKQKTPKSTIKTNHQINRQIPSPKS
jgi:hypothetical protein